MRNKRLQGRVLKANQTLTPNAHYESVYDTDKVIAVARKFGFKEYTGLSSSLGSQTGSIASGTSIYFSSTSLEEYNASMRTLSILNFVELIGTTTNTYFYVERSYDGGNNWSNIFSSYHFCSNVVPAYVYIIVYPNDYITITVDNNLSDSQSSPNLNASTGNIIRIRAHSATINYEVNYRNYTVQLE